MLEENNFFFFKYRILKVLEIFSYTTDIIDDENVFDKTIGEIIQTTMEVKHRNAIL